MKLAIADPPYPPLHGSGGQMRRASRWYGNKPHAADDVPADIHSDAAEWDAPARHRELLLDLVQRYDGWAIATSPDGIEHYAPLPSGTRVMAWVKTNAQPGSHRIRSMWEAVIVFAPESRRSNRDGIGAVADVHVCGLARTGFVGSKPSSWTHWVLDALSYDPDADTVDDLFPGLGAVTRAVANYPRSLFGGA